MKDRLSNSDFLKLRSWRAFREKDLGIGQIVENLARQAAAQQKRIGGIGEVWNDIVPAGVRKVCDVKTLTSGVLTVKVAGAAARFQVDRWLRSGGEALLHKHAGVKRIRIT